MCHSLNFRSATPDDAQALQDLYLHLSSDNAPCEIELAKSNVKKLAAFEGSAVLIGQIRAAIVVTCTLIIIPNLTRGGAPYALIENVVTHADHRGKGYGKLILDVACDRAWQHNCYKVMLSTGSTKPSVLGFYERAGFEQSRTGFQKRRLGARKD